MTDVLFGIGLGASIGLAYAAASLATARWAARFDDQRFLLVFFGGVLARLAVAVVLVMLVVGLLEVHVPAFIGTLLFVFAVGLAVEVWVVHRGRSVGRGGA